MGREVCIPADRDLLSILSLSDLLTEEHDLTIEDLLLTITKEREECFKEISPVPEPLILETKILGSGTRVNSSVFLVTMPPPTPPMPGRMGFDLLIEVISEYKNRFKKMRIQTELLDLLRHLPVCRTGC